MSCESQKRALKTETGIYLHFYCPMQFPSKHPTLFEYHFMFNVCFIYIVNDGKQFPVVSVMSVCTLFF